MKIINEFVNTREGNDCLIITAIVLLEVNPSFYVVVSSEKYEGSWVNNAIEPSSEGFSDFNAANKRFNHLAQINKQA